MAALSQSCSFRPVFDVCMFSCIVVHKMKHITNTAFSGYTEVWKRVFGSDYKDKYIDAVTGLSGGGGEYPFYDIHIASSFSLKPRQFVLGHSVECFDVPYNYYLKTGNKSTLARMGIDASFNTYIDNGFKGYLTIEIFNCGGDIIKLVKGQPILKVELIPCLFSCKPYDGKYQNQPNRPVEAILDK